MLIPQLPNNNLNFPKGKFDRSRNAKSTKVSPPEPAKATDKVKAPKPARPRSPALRKAKPARGEFDISHILDAGK